MYINSRIDKPWSSYTMGYYTAVKNEQIISTHIDIHESHNCNEKKTIAEYMLYNPFYVMFQNMVSCAIYCLWVGEHAVKG